MKNYTGCFLTGTAAEITPVSQIDNYNFKICNVITDLNDSYQALVRKNQLPKFFFQLLKQTKQIFLKFLI